MRRAIGLILLLLAIGTVGVIVGRSVAPPPRAPTREEVETDVGLGRVVADVNFSKTPLEQAIALLRQQTATNLVVKWKVLEAAGIDGTMPINLHVTNLPLRRVLELVCDEAGGGGTVKLNARAMDGAIVVSTADDHSAYAQTRLYDVRDLLQANYEFRVRLGWRPATNPSGNNGAQTLFAVNSSTGAGPDPTQDAIDALTHIITDLVAPDQWRDNGGTIGTIREYDGRLLITGTPDMHEEITALLDMLRKGK